MLPIMKQSAMLLSGLLCDETFWTDIPQRLAGIAEVQVVSFRGFSSLQAMAQHVLDIAPQRFAVAGHSMGGRVALEIMRFAPERVTGLALLNTGVQAVRDGEPQSRSHLLRVAYEHGMSALAAEWLPPMMGSDAARALSIDAATQCDDSALHCRRLRRSSQRNAESPGGAVSAVDHCRSHAVVERQR